MKDRINWPLLRGDW